MNEIGKKKSLISQKELKKLVANNKTREALGELSRYFDEYDWPKLESQSILLSSKYKSWIDYKNNGTISNEKLSEIKAQIDEGILSVVDNVFEELRLAQIILAQKKNPPKKIGIREDKLKREITFWIFFSKITIILFLLFMLDTGLMEKRFWGIFSLTLPVFSVYVGMVLQEMVKNRYVTNKKKTYRFIKSHFRYATHIVFPIYTIAILIIISNQEKGVYDQELYDMNQWIGLVEMLLGSYMGIIITSLFEPS